MIQFSDQDSKQMDVEIFNKPIQSLINDRTCSTLTEYIRSRMRDSKLGPSLLTIKDTDTISDAFELLKKGKIQACPVINSQDSSVIGMVSIMDLLSETLLSKSFDDFELWSQFDSLQMEEWNQKHSEIYKGIMIRDVIEKKNRFRIFHSDEGIQSMVDYMLKHHEHRVVVVDKNRTNDLNYTTIISQTDILYYFFLNQKSVPQSVLNLKAKDIMQVAMPAVLRSIPMNMDRFVKTAPIVAPCDTPTVIALRVMKLYDVSCIGVVDPEGSLAGNLSPSDFRGYDFSDLSSLTYPVLTFIKLQHQVDPRAWCISCEKDDELMVLIHRILKAKVHRIWVCDESLHPLGVVTMTDILTALMQV
jgi:CBS-domain-containing membrane protein